MPQDSNKVYYGIGMRDALANVATLIRAKGLIEGTREILDSLHRFAPENPHIEPAREIVAECEAALTMEEAERSAALAQLAAFGGWVLTYTPEAPLDSRYSFSWKAGAPESQPQFGYSASTLEVAIAMAMSDRKRKVT